LKGKIRRDFVDLSGLTNDNSLTIITRSAPRASFKASILVPDGIQACLLLDHSKIEIRFVFGVNADTQTAHNSCKSKQMISDFVTQDFVKSLANIESFCSKYESTKAIRSHAV
jgi:hypothetical protein